MARKRGGAIRRKRPSINAKTSQKRTFGSKDENIESAYIAIDCCFNRWFFPYRRRTGNNPQSGNPEFQAPEMIARFAKPFFSTASARAKSSSVSTPIVSRGASAT